MADVHIPGDGFIDLGLVSPAAEQQPSAGCLVEIQKENGTLLRVRIGDGAFLDWQWIKDAFLQGVRRGHAFHYATDAHPGRGESC